MDGWVGEWMMDGWMGGWVGRWMDGWTSGWWMDDEQMMDDGWMDKQNGVPPHSGQRCSREKEGSLDTGCLWMDLEPTMPGERSQTQKDTPCGIPWRGNVQNRQVHRERKRVHGARGWGWGWASDSSWEWGLLGGDEKWIEVVVVQYCKCAKYHQD